MTYPALYGATYGSGFPWSPLPVKVEHDLGGTWTDVTAYVLQRDGTGPAITITRGRPDETATASPAQASHQLSNRDGRFTARNPLGPYYGKFGRNVPERISVPDVTSYLRMEDDSVSSASTAPVMAPGRGNQDIRVDMDLTGWSPCCLASLWGSGQRAWIVLLNGDGTVALSTSTDGTTGTLQTATSTMPLPLGPGVLRVTLDKTSGDVTFWTAPAGGISAGPWTQLGQVVTSMSGGRTLFASAAPVSVGYNSVALNTDALGAAGLNGRVLDFMLFSSGPPVAVITQAGFSSQAAGTASWTDAYGNSWTANGTALIDDASYRFHGELSSLPTAWDPSGKDVWVPVTASGILRRIQAGNTPVTSPMKRYVRYDTVKRAYWTLEDGAAATQFGPGVSGGFPMQVIIGSPLPASDTSFLCSAPLPVINGSSWHGDVGNYADTGTIVVRFLLNVGSSVSGSTAPVRINTDGPVGSVEVVWSGGSLSMFAGLNPLGGGVSLTAGKPVLVSAELSWSSGGGGTITSQLRIMDTSGNIVSGAQGTTSGFAALGRVLGIDVAPADSSFGSASNTVIGHLYVQDVFNQLAGTPQTVIQAWAGETAGNRFARLCAENGIQARVYGYPDTTAAMGAQAQGSLSQLLQECETADMGLIHDPRTCLGLGYRTLASLCDQSAKVTLDYSQAHLGQAGQPGEWQPVDDDQQTRNDIQVTRQSTGGGSAAEGATYEAVLDDGSPMSVSPPPVGVGDYDTQVSANVQSDGQLSDVAGWLLHIGTVNEERYPAIPLNLARGELSGLYASVISLDLGDHVQVANTPAWMPPPPVKQLVYGTSERLGGFWYLADWQAVPESPYETALLDDPVLGRLDTDGSALHGGVTAVVSALAVDTLNPASPAWVTDPAEFPFGVIAGGEEMTVTAITSPGTWLTGQDAGFEGGPGSWGFVSGCTVAVTGAQAHRGASSLAVTALGSADMLCRTLYRLPVVPGDTVTVTGFFRAATAGRTCWMSVFWQDASQVDLSRSDAASAPDITGGWSTPAATAVTAPAGAAYACAGARITSPAGAGEVHYIDDVQITTATNPQNFTVIRSANGIVKAHAAGEDLRLAGPCYLAVT